MADLASVAGMGAGYYGGLKTEVEEKSDDETETETETEDNEEGEKVIEVE